MKCLATALAFAGLAVIACRSYAQTTQPATVPGLPPGWEQIDQRLVFLTVQLASVETSLAAVNNAIRISGHEHLSKEDAAAQAHKANERMDRKGGGPVPWQQFYGATAENFYHHSSATLSTLYAGSSNFAQFKGTSSSINRPPQFDYIYRANADIEKRAEAEVARLEGKMNLLVDRRRQLESQQGALWCRIAFRSMSSREFGSKPVYRFELTVPGNEDLAIQRQRALRAAAAFVRTADAAIADAQDDAEDNPAGTFNAVAACLTRARSQLNDELVAQLLLSVAMDDPNTPFGQFVAASRRLADVSQNAAEAEQLLLDNDKAGDISAKQTFQAQLQASLFDCAASLYATNGAITALVKEWNATPDVQLATTKPSRIHVPHSLFDAPQPDVDASAEQKDAPAPTEPPKQLEDAQIRPLTPPRASSAVTPIRSMGIALIIKGEAKVYLNAREIVGSNLGINLLANYPVRFSEGDIIVIRARSSFVYRAFRVGLTQHDGKAMAIADLRVLGDVPVDSISAQSVAKAPRAPTGSNDGALDPPWHQAGFDDIVQPYGLLEKDRWYTYAAIVRVATRDQAKEALGLDSSSPPPPPQKGSEAPSLPNKRLSVLAGPIIYKDHKYYLLSQSNWIAAEGTAVRLGGHLVTINDAAENQFISKTFGKQRELWIGLTDQNSPGKFAWSSGQPVNYTNWAPGEPNQFKDSGEHWTLMHRATHEYPAKWNDFKDATDGIART